MKEQFQFYVDIALGCIASDGEIDKVEVDCLKSIWIQRGQAADDFKQAYEASQKSFDKDASSFVDSFVPELREMQGNLKEQVALLEVLIELIVSDGIIQNGELDYLRFIMQLGGWDMSKIVQERPEWRPYIQQGFETNLELRSKVIDRILAGIS